MNTTFKRLVEHFGSQSATAEALKVKQGSVSGWIRGVHGCSAEVALRAEILTEGKILARDLRPSLPERAGADLGGIVAPEACGQ